MVKITLMNCSLCNNAGILRKDGEDSIMCPLCKGTNMKHWPRPQPLTKEQVGFVLQEMNSMTGDLNLSYGEEMVQEAWVKYWRSLRKFTYYPPNEF